MCGANTFQELDEWITAMTATRAPAGYKNRFAAPCFECAGTVKAMEGRRTIRPGGSVVIHEKCPEAPTPVAGVDEYRFSKRSGQWKITGPDLRVGKVVLVTKRTGPSEWYLLDAVDAYGAAGTALTIFQGESVERPDLRAFRLRSFRTSDNEHDERVLRVVLENVGVASDGTFWVIVAEQTFKRPLSPDNVVARPTLKVEEAPAAEQLAKTRAFDAACELLRANWRNGEQDGPEGELSEIVRLDGDEQDGRYAGFSSDGARIILWSHSAGRPWQNPRRTSVTWTKKLEAAVRLIANSDEPWFW